MGKIGETPLKNNGKQNMGYPLQRIRNASGILKKRQESSENSCP